MIEPWYIACLDISTQSHLIISICLDYLSFPLDTPHSNDYLIVFGFLDSIGASRSQT